MKANKQFKKAGFQLKSPRICKQADPPKGLGFVQKISLHLEIFGVSILQITRLSRYFKSMYIETRTAGGLSPETGVSK